MNKMNTMVMMHGCSGSGKSTLAQQINTAALQAGQVSVICSTDSLFMVDGVYKFDYTKLGAYHKENLRAACQAVDLKADVVIIDNTNLTAKEMLPYVKYAIEHDYAVQIREPNTGWAYNYEELVKRNVHGVPATSVRKMIERKEDVDDIGVQLAIDVGCEYDLVTQTLHREWSYHEEENCY